MAKSGTINGTKSGTKPYLRIKWDIASTDVAGNRSQVRLRLYLVAPYTVKFSASKSGKLHGASFTYTGGMNGTGEKLLHTRNVWVGHNSDGTKTQSFSGSFNIAISYSGSNLGTLSVSGNATLDPIPRASTLSSGSISSALKVGTKNTLNLGISRKHSSFTHLVTILDGGTWVHDWGYGTGTPSSLEMNGTAVNRILARMGSVTSKSFTLRLRTYSGSNGNGYIGESTRTITATVDESVKPKINSHSATIIGNEWAKGQGIYVQGQTGVQAEFSSNAVGGASVKSRNIKISNTNGGSVVGSVFRHSINTLNSSGKITITYEITDTRNRKTTATRTIDILAYSPPKITSVKATRKSSDRTKVDVYRAGTTSSLGDKNQATLKIDYKRTTATSWTNLTSINFYGAFGATNTAEDIPISASYDFRVTVTDKLGQSASSQESVSTAKVLMSYNKDIGVGIGKIHERGALDVSGLAYFSDGVTIKGATYMEGGIQSKFLPSDTDLNNIKKAGFYYNNSNAQVSTMSNVPVKVAFSLLVENHAGIKQTFTRYESHTPQTWVRNYYNGTWGAWSTSYLERGQNSNGNWYRFSNGLQICISTFAHNFTTSITAYVDLPKEYASATSFSGFVGASNNYWLPAEQSSAVGHAPYSSSRSRIQRFNSSNHTRGDDNASYRLITIGWWK